MKNISQILKNLIVLFVLCIFPTGIFLIIEYAVTHEISRSSDYAPLCTLIGAVLSVIVFSKQKSVSISVQVPSVRSMLSMLGIGFALKQCLLYLLCLTIGMNITGSLNTSLFALASMLFITPIGEEIIFRGILPDLLNPQKSKTKLCFAVVLLIASLIWTAAHLHGMSVASLLLFADGVMMTAIYLKYRNLVLTIMYHVAVNASMLIVGTLNEKYYGIAAVICVLILIASVFNLIHLKHSSASNAECNTNLQSNE